MLPAGGEGGRVALERDLDSSLSELALLSVGGRPLEESLTRIAGLAVRALPGADAAGLALLEEGRPTVVVGTVDLVAEIDALQHRLGQGPCLDAASRGVVVSSGSLGGDPRWQRFGSRVARLGVHSVVVLPLRVGRDLVGTVGVYARAKHVFDERATAMGEVFAGPAAIAVENARVLERAARAAQRVRFSLEDRAVVDQAVGIMVARSGGTTAEALERLRSLSQQQHTRMPVLARSIVEETVRRSRARHTERG